MGTLWRPSLMEVGVFFVVAGMADGSARRGWDEVEFPSASSERHAGARRAAAAPHGGCGGGMDLQRFAIEQSSVCHAWDGRLANHSELFVDWAERAWGARLDARPRRNPRELGPAAV